MLAKFNKHFLFGALSIIWAATLWSLDGTLIRPHFYEFPAMNIVFIEHIFGAMLLSPFLIWWRKRIYNMSSRTKFSLVWVSFFWWLLGTLMITEAYFAAFRGDTTFATVILLQKLQPIFALVGAAIVLRERLSAWFYGWAGIAIFSAYMIAFGSLWKDIFQVDILHSAAFYALLAAFAFGTSTVFGKNLVDKLGFRVSTALRFTLTALLSFCVVYFLWDFSVVSSFTDVHWRLFGIILFTSGAGALFLYYFWLRKVTASSATIFELAWPLSWVFFDWYFNGNILSSIQICFSFLLLISFFMIIEEQKRKNDS